MIFYCTNGVWHRGDPKKPIAVAPLQPLHTKPGTIPMEIAEEAYKEYAEQYGTQQTLQRLNERGGFGAEELAGLLFERIKRIESGR